MRFQPGGTPGGGAAFFGGLVMMAVGVYMVFDRVTVHTSFWHFFGGAQTSFGVTLLPVLAGIGLLTYSGKSLFGWLLAVGGLAIILAGVLMNMDIYFRPTSLWTTVIMFGLIAAGLGLFAKGLREHPAD